VAAQVGARVSVSPPVQQLQDQQRLLTQALSSMLQGQWCGSPPSTQAFVSALDPNQTFDCTPPLLAVDAPPPAPPFLANYNPNTDMPRQAASWSCSACALAWVLRATGLDPNCYEQCGIDHIGYPTNINSTYGLMDGSGSQLQRVLGEYGQTSEHSWLSFDSAYSIYSQAPGCMSGTQWYHWVGVRGVSDGNLWIANSAPGYQGVYDILSRSDWNRLGGFSCIWLTP
jgi:hypothetical protein